LRALARHASDLFDGLSADLGSVRVEAQFTVSLDGMKP
jgi:hypothetical protein